MYYFEPVKTQSPRSVVMVRPAAFGFNPQTASSNAFQVNGNTDTGLSALALKEFDAMVALMRSHDIEVIVVDDNPNPPKPDAVFPNNWISFHEDGAVLLYPMLAENRRLERENPVFESLKGSFNVRELIDFSPYEAEGKFMEGTGSMVIDYVNQIAYANRSPRTNDEVFKQVCKRIGCKPILFDAADEHGVPIYHTNVLMCIGTRFCVICLDAIRGEADQELLLNSFRETGHKVVAIGYAQMNAFAGNMLEVENRMGEKIVLLSKAAFDSLLPGQANAIAQHATLLPIPIPTIEKVGGGSVRCMVAGVFNPKLN